MKRFSPKPKTRPIVVTLALIALLLTLSSQRGYGNSLEDLRPVGSTTLKVLFWTIYDSTLYSPDGDYSGIEPGLALHLEYRRNIASQRLVNTTRDQWQELGIYDEQLSEPWLDELSRLWPDIRRGDSVTLVVAPGLAARFYYNGELLGVVDDGEFTRRFLAIWLDEKSAYPKQRDQLTGAG